MRGGLGGWVRGGSASGLAQEGRGKEQGEVEAEEEEKAEEGEG